MGGRHGGSSPPIIRHPTSLFLLRLRDKALCLLLLDTGLRLHEAQKLTVADTSKDALLIRGKGGKQRVVFLSHEARPALKRYLKACPYPLQEDRTTPCCTSTLRLWRQT
jgi:site-specific recombinase XerD